MKPDQRVKYLVPVVMVALAVVGFVTLTAIDVINGGEFSEGLVLLWMFQVAPALLLMASFLGAVFLAHDWIKSKNSL